MLRKVRKFTRSHKNQKVEWVNAPDIKKRVIVLVKKLNENHLDISRLFFFRSHYTKTRAIARIWAFPRIWQLALKQKPAYSIEIISERFDHLSNPEKDKVLIHELAHIPQNFSGSLVPHIRHGKRKFSDKVKRMILKSNI